MPCSSCAARPRAVQNLPINFVQYEPDQRLVNEPLQLRGVIQRLQTQAGPRGNRLDSLTDEFDADGLLGLQRAFAQLTGGSRRGCHRLAKELDCIRGFDGTPAEQQNHPQAAARARARYPAGARVLVSLECW